MRSGPPTTATWPSARSSISHLTWSCWTSACPAKLSGVDVANLVRARLRCPILFISGRDPPTPIVRYCVEPGDRYLRKPFSMNALLVEVSGLVGAVMPTEVKPPGHDENRQLIRAIARVTTERLDGLATVNRCPPMTVQGRLMECRRTS